MFGGVAIYGVLMDRRLATSHVRNVLKSSTLEKTPCLHTGLKIFATFMIVSCLDANLTARNETRGARAVDWPEPVTKITLFDENESSS